MKVTTIKVSLSDGYTTASSKPVESAEEGRRFIHMGARALSGAKGFTVITVLPEMLVYASDRYRWNVFLEK